MALHKGDYLWKVGENYIISLDPENKRGLKIFDGYSEQFTYDSLEAVPHSKHYTLEYVLTVNGQSETYLKSPNNDDLQILELSQGAEEELWNA